MGRLLRVRNMRLKKQNGVFPIFSVVFALLALGYSWPCPLSVLLPSGTKPYILSSIGPLIFLSFHVAALQQRPAAAVVHLRHRLHLLQGNPRAGQDHRPHRRPRVHQHRRMHDGETDHEREREGERRGRGGGWLLFVGCVVVTYVVCCRVASRFMYVAP